MKFPNGETVETPEGRGMVVNADRPDERQVQFSDSVAGLRVKTFPIEQLRRAKKLDHKALQKRASRIIGKQVKEHIPSGSVQKHMRKQNSGETSLQNAQESDGASRKTDSKKIKNRQA